MRYEVLSFLVKIGVSSIRWDWTAKNLSQRRNIFPKEYMEIKWDPTRFAIWDPV